MADIPGLLEGAHRNVGLGHSFLKHIERTKLLIFVLDMAGVDGRDPVSDLKVLRDELARYMPGLEKRSALIVANKMDLEGAEENLERLRKELAAEPIEIVPVSAGVNELGEFKDKLRAAVEIAKNRYY
jgi:GTP-binding protein